MKFTVEKGADNSIYVRLKFSVFKETVSTLSKEALFKVRKVAKIRIRYNQVPHLTQDATWESDKNTMKHHKREPRGQSFPSR